MFEDLLRLYKSNVQRSPDASSIFAETQLFNEGWLLSGVLNLWLRYHEPSCFPFLPFPANCRSRSPVQLYSPYRKLKRNDKLGETNTRADGIVGVFQGDSSKSGVVMPSDATFLASFKAKMYSGFSPIKYSPYSQVARTISCLIFTAIKAEVELSAKLHFAVLYPQDANRIIPSTYLTIARPKAGSLA